MTTPGLNCKGEKCTRALLAFYHSFLSVCFILLFFQLVVMMGVRKLLDRVFDKSELKILDDILPEFTRHEKLDEDDARELGVSCIFYLLGVTKYMDK